MALVGFRARNHRQQVSARGAVDVVDDRMTPLNLWIPWNDRWHFTLDAAASKANTLCDRFYTLEDDGLSQPWAGERVWLNPPFSDMTSWVQKTWDEMEGGDCELVAMLAPANRTEQRWWQSMIEPYRDGRDLAAGRNNRSRLTTEFLPSRINFAKPDNLGAYYPSSAPFGCVLLVWIRTAISHSDAD